MTGVIRAAALFDLLSPLAVCSGPASYGRMTDREGDREQKLEQNRSLIAITGKPRTSRDTVEHEQLYSASETSAGIRVRFRGFSASFGRNGFGSPFRRSGINPGISGWLGRFYARPVNRMEAFAGSAAFL